MDLVESIVAIKKKGGAPVIAEIKRLIPKLAAEAGLPLDKRNAGKLAKAYELGGACGISLVTETKYFGGQPEQDIPAVLHTTNLPLLIKDFNRTKENLDYYVTIVRRCGKEYLGRVVILLISHWLENKLPEMLDYVHHLGMLALVETRSPFDLEYLSGARPALIGMNNKNIDGLEKEVDRILLDRQMVEEYRQKAGRALLISESGHRQPEDVIKSLGAGADAVLIGTAFMTAAYPSEAVNRFAGALGGSK